MGLMEWVLITLAAAISFVLVGFLFGLGCELARILMERVDGADKDN